MSAGKSFQAKIHVEPGKGWHVWSMKMPGNVGPVPLQVTIPDSIARYFSIISVREIGKPVVGYDSNFEITTTAYYQPFDVVATIKPRVPSSRPIPFSLMVQFQCCSSTVCMPPRTFRVPMAAMHEKPIPVTIGPKKNRVPKPTAMK